MKEAKIARPRGLYMTYIPPSRYLTLTQSNDKILHIKMVKFSILLILNIPYINK